MKIKFFVLLLSIALASCTLKNSSTSKNIEGEWVAYEKAEHSFRDYYAIRFEDGKYYRINKSGPTHIGSYRLRNDSIVVNEGGKDLVSRVVKMTIDSLVIKSGDDLYTYYNRKLEYNPRLSLTNLNIRAGMCFGECPEFILSIDSDSLRFSPIKNCIVNSNIAIKTDPQTWKKMDSLFRWSRIQQIDTVNRFILIDDWAVDLDVSYNTNQSLKIRGSYDGLPYRLRPVAHTAIAIAKKSHWIK